MARGKSEVFWTITLALFTGCEWNRPAVALADSSTVAFQEKTPPAPSERRLQQEDNDESDSAVKTAAYTQRQPDPALVAVRVRAQVNGVAILDSEVKEACYPQLLATQSLPEPERSARRAEIFRQQLDQIVDREVILQDLFQRLAKQKRVLENLDQAADKEFDKRLKTIKEHNKNLQTDEDMKKAFTSMGLTMEGFRRQVKRDFMAREYMRNLVFPNVETGLGLPQIREYYLQHPEEFKQDDRVEWQDIFIDQSKYTNRDEARRTAQYVVKLASTGQDFLKLATQYDKENSGFGKAEGLGQKRGEIRPTECEPYLFQMKPGDVGPVIELPTGFHVFRLVKREFAGQTPFNDQIQDEIRKKLQMQVAEREWKYVLDDLKKKARVKIIPD
jgi:peptidyl-prolyl cis-trans isomerase SurA